MLLTAKAEYYFCASRDRYFDIPVERAKVLMGGGGYFGLEKKVCVEETIDGLR